MANFSNLNPERGDSNTTLWKKILVALQSRPGSLARNNATIQDTKRNTINKVLRSLLGI
jgi:hypothetical protein